MKKINVKDWRMMLLVGAAAGALVAAPLGAHALTNQEDDSPDQTQTTTETNTEINDDSQATDTPADTTATETSTNTDTQNTPVTQTPDPTNEPEQPGETETTTSPTVADLQSAITIASAEHPNVQAISAKLKKLKGNDVYKVVFADGWMAYVSADNGSVLLLQDKDGDKHTCQNRARSTWLKNHKNWKPFDTEFSAYSSSWVAKKNWSGAKHNWQPQQSTDTEQSETSSSDDTATTSATQTTSAQKSTSKAYGNTHHKTNSWKH